MSASSPAVEGRPCYAVPRALLRSTRILLLAAPLLGCDGEGRGALSASEMPLHLEDHLEGAEVEAEVAAGDLEPLRWSLAEQDPAWRPLPDVGGGSREISWGGGGLTLSLAPYLGVPGAPTFLGGAAVPVPDLDPGAWSEIVVRARTDGAQWLNVGYNLGERHIAAWNETLPVRYLGTGTRLVVDGREHVYRLPVGAMLPGMPSWEPGEPWRELALTAWAQEETTVEIVAVEVVPRMAKFADAPAGVATEHRGPSTRRTIYTHTPGSLRYRVEVPPGGRLDFAAAVLQSTRPSTFRVTASSGDGERALFEEEVGSVDWQQRSVDLSRFAGDTVELTLSAAGEPGGIALWSSPTVSGERPRRRGRRPNVVFYVIDGAGADLMSLYGYNRRNTPNLERLAAEGVVFEQAYSNSGWTKPSTASFMTSLHQSVLGGFMSLQDQIPAAVIPMAERFHRAGYQTAVFTSNPWAGSLSGLERGVDRFRDHEEGDHHSTSSAILHREYFDWREDHPGEPYWVHFQTTDVHEPHEPAAPFAGLYVDPERRTWFHDTWRRMEADGAGHELWQRVQDPRETLADLYRERLAELEVEPRRFFDVQRGLYDETMAHQDHQLGRLVERLKASGEWEDTLLVVASDHGHPAGSFSRFGRELFDPLPASDEGALLDSYRSRIPLAFIWPGHLPAGRRVSEPVSMIDVLPTLLELAGLPAPEILQGQSLVPLLRGEPGWEPRPIILEQLQPVPDHDALVGHIEMIDGRWGASLEIWPDDLDPAVARPDGNQRAARPHREGMPRLYLYDLWSDPFARRRVNDEHPELVAKYTRLLEEQWKQHQILARHFEPGAEVEMTAEQLESLRALGYIQ